MTNQPLPFFGQRRNVVLGGALVAVASTLRWLPSANAQALRATPSQAEGPFYPIVFGQDLDADLLTHGTQRYTKGEVAWVQGQVTDLQGRPVRGAVVEIWQCDHGGHYHHPADGGRADQAFQGFGRAVVASDGSYRFRTLRPAPYSGRTPHIHVKVKLDRNTLLTTQLYVQGDPGNARDGLWRNLDAQARAALTRNFVPGLDGLRADFPLVLAL